MKIPVFKTIYIIEELLSLRCLWKSLPFLSFSLWLICLISTLHSQLYSLLGKKNLYYVSKTQSVTIWHSCQSLLKGRPWMEIRGPAGQDRDKLTEDCGGNCSLFLTVYLILTNISTVYHLRLWSCNNYSFYEHWT